MASVCPTALHKVTSPIRRQPGSGNTPDTCPPSGPVHRADGIAPSSNTQASIASRRTSRRAKHSPYTIRFVEVRGGTARFVPRSTIQGFEGRDSDGDVVEIDIDEDEADEEAVVKAVLGELDLQRRGRSGFEDSESPSSAPSTVGFAQDCDERMSIDCNPPEGTDAPIWPGFLPQNDDEDKSKAIHSWLQTHSSSDFNSQSPKAHTHYGPPHVDSGEPRLGGVWHKPAGFPYVDRGLGYTATWIPFICEIEWLVRDRLTFRKKARIVQQAPDGRRSVLREWDDENVGEWLVDAPSDGKTGDEEERPQPTEDKPSYVRARADVVGPGEGREHGGAAYFEEYFTVVQRALDLGTSASRDDPVSASLTPLSNVAPRSTLDSMNVDKRDDSNTINSRPRYYVVIKKHLDDDQKLLSSVYPHGPVPQRSSR